MTPRFAWRGPGGRTHALTFAVVVATTLLSCDAPTAPPKPTSIVLGGATAPLDAIGATVQLTATVQDQNGKPMGGQVPTWTSSAAGVATVDATGRVTAVSNGSATITASLGGAAATAAVTVAQVAVAPLVVSGEGQVAAVLAALPQPIVARAVDRLGAPMAGVTVTFAIAAGGGSLAEGASVTTKSVVSAANGEAQTIWRLGGSVSESQRVSVTVNAQTTFINATATGGTPTRIVKAPGVAADAQRAKVGTAVDVAPAVQLQDSLGNPVAGRTVTFTVTGGGGSVTGGSVVTNASGVATAGTWTLGAAAGTNTLRAAFGTLTTDFTATAVLDPCTAAGATPLTLPATVNGTLSNTDCTWSPPAGTSGNDRFDLYRFDLPARSTLIVELNAGTGLEDPYLFMYDATSVDSVAANDDVQQGVLRNSRISVTLNAGSYLVRATTWGATERGAYTLSVRACRVGEPAIYRVSAGNGQVVAPGTAVGTRPSVEVLDECGTGVSGVPVTFATVPGVGSITGATTATNASGVATVGSWTLAAGPNVLSATAGGTAAALAPVIVSATGKTSTAGFDISLRFATMPTFTQLTTFGQAAARWESIITGDLPNIPAFSVPAGTCTSPVAIQEALDDLIIVVRLEPIDGPGAVLGAAGPCLVRTAGLPALGVMRFDTSDLAALEAAGTFAAVILHEMGHVLGIGTLWDLKGFLRLPSTASAKTDTHFNGPEAIAAFNAIGGATYTGAGQQVPGGAKVPVENCTAPTPPSCGEGTINSHWREGVLRAELMTGYLNTSGANPLSVLTIGSLKDLGYVVDPATADAFFEPMNATQGPSAGGGVLSLGNDVERRPVLEVRPDGTIVGALDAPARPKRRSPGPR